MAKKAKKKVAKKKPAKMGCPTKYKPEYCQQVDEYIKRCNDTPEGEERELSTRAGVAILFDVCLSTIDTWEKKYPDFMGTLKKVARSQQSQLINRCLNGTGNATIGKMLLSANHGLHERHETEHSGSIGIAGLLDELDGETRGLPK